MGGKGLGEGKERRDSGERALCHLHASLGCATKVRKY